MTGPRALAIIPARGGSKRLPRKNVLPFRDRPMIAWTVRAALDCGVFARVIVTTEDDGVAQATHAEGAEVLRRPSELAADHVPLTRVAAHALAACPGYDAFCLMMANCPLRGAEDVRDSLRAFEQSDDATALTSVFAYNWNQPFWALKMDGDRLKRLFPQTDAASGDDVVCPSGAIRWCRTQDFLKTETWYPERLRGFRMPWHRAIDIDTSDDYAAACCIAHALDSGFRFPEAAH